MSNMEELIRQTVEKTTGVNRIAKSVQTLAGNGAALDRDVFVLASMLLKSQQKIIDLQDELLDQRSEEHTSELQSLMRISYAVFCLKKKTIDIKITETR